VNPRRLRSSIVALGLVVLAVTTLTSCEQVGVACTASSPAITSRQLTVGGLTRKFFTHQSSVAAPAAGRPVVFYFHGDGGTGNVNLASLYAQTDPDGAIVVQLDGPNNVPGQNRGSTAWSFFMNGSTPDDVAFTRNLLDHMLLGTLLPGVPIDTKRVYAVGASRGGFMVDTLIVDARTAGAFAGVVNVSGNFYCESGDATCTARTANGGFATSTPVLHIHGDADGAVPTPAAVPNPVTASISWPWPVAQFASANGCSGVFAYQATVTPSIGAKPTYRYKPSGTCAQDDQLVLIKGGGHVPSGWEPHAWSYLKTKSRP
jgi:poly(3-hydroxybutyrate) depolymerase